MSYQENSEIYSANNFFTLGKGIVTLCGSTKFFTECMEINRRLTFDGWIVLMCGSWGHSYHKYQENKNTDYQKVKTLHYYKILHSHAIVIVSDKTGYQGESTKAEIKFAKEIKKPIFYFDGEYLFGETYKTPYNAFKLFEETIKEYVAKGNSLGF